MKQAVIISAVVTVLAVLAILSQALLLASGGR